MLKLPEERRKWGESKGAGTYRKGYYFYSPQTSTVIKSKMAATTILRTRTRFRRPKIRLHCRLTHECRKFGKNSINHARYTFSARNLIPPDFGERVLLQKRWIFVLPSLDPVRLLRVSEIPVTALTRVHARAYPRAKNGTSLGDFAAVF